LFHPGSAFDLSGVVLLKRRAEIEFSPGAGFRTLLESQARLGANPKNPEQVESGSRIEVKPVSGPLPSTCFEWIGFTCLRYSGLGAGLNSANGSARFMNEQTAPSKQIYILEIV